MAANKIVTIDKNFYKELGYELAKIRHARNLSIRDVAKKTGYSRQTIDNWEIGASKIKPEQFDNLCKALRIAPKTKISVEIGF